MLPGRRLFASLVLLAVACLANVAAHAHSEAALQQFQTGREAFEKQDYATALQAFEAALAAGMTGPAIHFNIGVAAYRYGRFDRATAAFHEVARTPQMAALGHYNLGLVALRLPDRKAAKRWFSRAQEETTDDRLRELASTQLADLLPDPADRNWIGYSALSAGYDDNVALASRSDLLAASDKEDSFADVQLAFTAPLEGPWRFDAGLALLDNQHVDQFDQASANGGARYRLAVGNWMNEIGLQLAYSTLDHAALDNRRTLVLQTRNAPRSGRQLSARYRFSDIAGMNQFSGMSGQRHEFDGRIGWVENAWEFTGEYRFDMEEYDDESLSATRHQLGFDLQRTVAGVWTMTMEAAWRQSRYDLDSNGSETRTELSLAVARALTTRWRVILRYTYTNNDADLDEFNYRRNRISAGVEATL